MSALTHSVPLGSLKPGSRGTILSLTPDPEGVTQRLLEMGLLEGSPIEVMHEAPFGRDPIAVRVRGTLIALRRQEANLVEVILHE